MNEHYKYFPKCHFSQQMGHGSAVEVHISADLLVIQQPEKVCRFGASDHDKNLGKHLGISG